jgi:hypothetical protein
MTISQERRPDRGSSRVRLERHVADHEGASRSGSRPPRWAARGGGRWRAGSGVSTSPSRDHDREPQPERGRRETRDAFSFSQLLRPSAAPSKSARHGRRLTPSHARVRLAVGLRNILWGAAGAGQSAICLCVASGSRRQSRRRSRVQRAVWPRPACQSAPVNVRPAWATAGSQTNTPVTTAATATRMSLRMALLLSRCSERDTGIRRRGARKIAGCTTNRPLPGPGSRRPLDAAHAALPKPVAIGLRPRPPTKVPTAWRSQSAFRLGRPPSRPLGDAFTRQRSSRDQHRGNDFL